MADSFPTIAQLTIAHDSGSNVWVRQTNNGPLTHDQLDQNWMRIGSKINETINGLEATQARLGEAEDEKLSAVPVATSAILGGVTIGNSSGLNISAAGAVTLNDAYINSLITTDREGNPSPLKGYARIEGGLQNMVLEGAVEQVLADGTGQYKFRLVASEFPDGVIIPLTSSIVSVDAQWEMSPVIISIDLVGGYWEVVIKQFASRYYSARDDDTGYENPFGYQPTMLYAAFIGK